MNQILLVSHGGLAQGALDALEMVLGHVPNVHAITLRRDDTRSIAQEVRELVNSFAPEDAVYACTDMLGSSVTNELVELASSCSRITVISGMNMPLVLSLAVSYRRLETEELCSIVVESREGLRICSADETRHQSAASVSREHVPMSPRDQCTRTTISLARLDYRLLHGQVVFAWVNALGAERIVVVSNEAASNEIKKGALRLAKPAGVRLNIFSVQQALAKMPKLNTLGENVMLIFGSTGELLEFCRSYPLAEVNYGATANHPGAEQVGGKGSSVFLDGAQKDDTNRLIELGVTVYVQQTPAQPRTEIRAPL